jgi:hypothetical protein
MRFILLDSRRSAQRKRDDVTRQKKKAAQPGIPTEATGFYRCPACGEKVDQESQEEIRLHHSHLRHRDGLAQRFDLSRAPYHHAAQTWILGKPRGCS